MKSADFSRLSHISRGMTDGYGAVVALLAKKDVELGGGGVQYHITHHEA
jgi:hypothetical protein